VLNIVNNQWAISTYQGIARGGSGTFAARGLGFGMPALRVDGNDYLAVHAVAKWAVGAGATQSRPDPRRICHLPRRRPLDLGRSFRLPAQDRKRRLAARRPVIRLKNHLIAKGLWSEERHRQAEAEVMDTVIAAQRQAEKHGTLHAGGKPSTRDMFEGVYETMPPHLRRQRQEAGV
jgi:2-oxoisovalerate dehydrogenase E1 component alpha subunit